MMILDALHGAVGSACDWDRLKLILSGSSRLVAHDIWKNYSQLGGGFDQFVEGFSKDILLNDDSDSRNLLGYSMGGRLALHALIAKPDLWNKAVIVSAHTGLALDERPNRKKRDLDWAEAAVRLSWNEFLLAWNDQTVLESKKAEEFNFDRFSLEKYKNEIADSFLHWSLGNQEDLLPQLKLVETPILWVVGEHDQKFASIAEKVMEVIPNGRLEIVSGAGHRVPWEASDVFSSLVREWLV